MKKRFTPNSPPFMIRPTFSGQGTTVMTSNIRLMTAADIPAVLAIERQCHGFTWSEEIFRDELEKPFARIELLELDGSIAGFLCWWLIAGEIEIQNVATAVAFRRRGVARRLVAHVLDEARRAGASRAILEARVGNSGAIALYREFGFSDNCIRRAYYPDGEDALLMELHLTPL